MYVCTSTSRCHRTACRSWYVPTWVHTGHQVWQQVVLGEDFFFKVYFQIFFLKFSTLIIISFLQVHFPSVCLFLYMLHHCSILSHRRVSCSGGGWAGQFRLSCLWVSCCLGASSGHAWLDCLGRSVSSVLCLPAYLYGESRVCILQEWGGNHRVVGRDVRAAFQPGPPEGLLCKLDGFLPCQCEVDFLTSVWGISRCLDTLSACLSSFSWP